MPNPAQQQAVARLGRIEEGLEVAAKERRKSPLVRWFSRFLFGDAELPMGGGAYVCGPVGRGKTVVMDLLVEAMEGSQFRTHRTHFHRFFAKVHESIHERRTSGQDTDDVVSLVACDIAADIDLLAFDEFYVNNIADAMMLGRFLSALFAQGVFVVMTSNDPPDQLYSGGLQRERFIPTIDLIKTRLDVLHMDAGRDYRLLQRRLPSTFHAPLGAAADRFAVACMSELTQDAELQPLSLFVNARRIEVPAAAKGFAWFGFEHLCERPMGSGDYLVLASEFKGLVISDVPILDDSALESAERFRILVDILYDQSRFLCLTADAPVEELVQSDQLAPALARTVSRLIEMQSPKYAAAALAA